MSKVFFSGLAKFWRVFRPDGFLEGIFQAWGISGSFFSGLRDFWKVFFRPEGFLVGIFQAWGISGRYFSGLKGRCAVAPLVRSIFVCCAKLNILQQMRSPWCDSKSCVSDCYFFILKMCQLKSSLCTAHPFFFLPGSKNCSVCAFHLTKARRYAQISNCGNNRQR